MAYFSNLLIILLTFFSSSLIAATSTQTETPSFGYGKLPYEAPAIGSYQLPPLGIAKDGMVLDEQGQPVSLHQLYQGKYILLSFIYSNCNDINGCPLSSYVFYKIKAAMQQDPQLAQQLKLVSLSFDPERDTPEIMRLYGSNFDYAGEKGEWQFVTTPSEKDLAPILQDYRQEVQREVSVNGEDTDYSHLLRVFLIDPEKKIRNIYSVGFLHPELLINDVKTLLAEAPQINHSTAIAQVPSLQGAGDYKEGYDSKNYETKTKSLDSRVGKATDLLALAQNPPLGLPPVPTAQELTKEKIELGRELFYDRRLSLNNTFSCAMCHVPEQGFTSNELAKSVGFEGRSVKRNAPTIYNTAYAKRLFHDGREDSLEQQVWAPLLADNEMANPSIAYVVNKIKGMSSYQGKFEEAFGQPANMMTIGQALAAYERTLVSGNSAFDRWHYGKESQAMSEAAQKGFQLFKGKAQCIACHSVGEKTAIFSDNQLHNTGLGYRESMGLQEEPKVLIAPGVTMAIPLSVINSVGHKPIPDIGLYEVTQDPADRWKYKTPSLRNVSLTAPYMHNGSLSTLKEVVQFYNQGGIPNENLSPLIRPLGLSDEEVDYLVAFMQALTGDNVDTLVADAFAAPVGDVVKEAKP